MMKDLIQSHFNKDISTEDLKQIVEKHITKRWTLMATEAGLFFDEVGLWNGNACLPV